MKAEDSCFIIASGGNAKWATAKVSKKEKKRKGRKWRRDLQASKNAQSTPSCSREKRCRLQSGGGGIRFRSKFGVGLWEIVASVRGAPSVLVLVPNHQNEDPHQSQISIVT